MATTERHSLPQRAPRMPMSPIKQSRVPSGTKRPRSPGVGAEEQNSRTTLKRARAGAATPTSQKNKSRDKEQQEKEFRDKYRRAILGFSFHFDMTDIKDDVLVQKLRKRIEELRGEVDDFFSKKITHFICTDEDGPAKPSGTAVEKENRTQQLLSGSTRMSHALRKSPSKHNLSVAEPLETMQSPFARAQEYKKDGGMKIWSIRKLDSVLARCLEQPTLISAATSSQTTKSAANQPRSLSRLLQSEKINGTTEKRTDFRYFEKGTYYVLVEDIRGELATIAIKQYRMPTKGSTKTEYPRLYCHPKARGPFIPFDEKEKRRWEKNQIMEKEYRREQEEYRKRKDWEFQEVVKMKEAQNELRRGGGDLRRSVSLNNLRRNAVDEHDIFDEGDQDSTYESANASGYLASGHGGYMAASGNSVQITSTTGTTSTTSGSHFLRRGDLPLSLQKVAGREVVTSLKMKTLINRKKENEMGPPTGIPERQGLRKSKSTNTLRLPKREEGSKPGYCESCRQKFDDFKVHIVSHRHKKFAANDANFSQLDCILDRVRRKTKEEVRRERAIVSMPQEEVYRGYGALSDEEMYDMEG